MGIPGEPLKLTVLGSGTSVGVPTIGCECEVCQSTDPRDNRLRPSVWLQFGGRSVLIDTTPDFRQQALRAHIERIDAILYTHAHADHILGLDDVRPFNFRQRSPIPVYANGQTLDAIRRCFNYIFHDGPTESSRPRVVLHELDGRPFDLFGLTCIPIRLLHGSGESFGFRLGPVAYLTDHSDIPEESMRLLDGLEVLFLDALRHKPHPTHSTVERSLGYVERLKPRVTYFTHICHDLAHNGTEQQLPRHVHLAYDGLEVEVALNDVR